MEGGGRSWKVLEGVVSFVMLPTQWRARFVWRCLLALVGMVFAAAAQAAPTIIITNLPAYGSTANLGGVVLNATAGAYSVAVFIYVPGYGWVTKPTCAQPLTVIQTNGSWTANITTGANDPLATRVAALVVSTNYNQPCVLGAAYLPTNVFAQAAASAVVTRASPGVRWLSFSGYDWWVKTSAGQVGPGPNYFSDSTNNLWLDAQGQLHVRITNRSNQWQCAELVSARTFGYGSYRFQLASPVDNLNPMVVLGLFTWSDDPVYADRELDIECSRWGNAADPTSAQYVVQPYNLGGHLVRIALPAAQTNSTHLFTWETNRVSFQSQRGSYVSNPNPANVISNWTYSLAVPQTGDENIRINLWLFNGSPPTDNQETEVVLKSFQFVPLGAAKPGLLTEATRAPGGPFHFALHGEFERRYTVQASTDLLNWQDLTTILATNSMMDFLDGGSAASGRTFYRTGTLP